MNKIKKKRFDREKQSDKSQALRLELNVGFFSYDQNSLISEYVGMQ